MTAAEHRRAAETALAHWDVDVAAIEFVNASENLTFRVDSSGGTSYVLRLHRPGYHKLDELESEQLWTRALREADIDVPVPLMTRDGSGYVAVDVGSERRYAGMLEWVDGVPLGEVVREREDTAFTQQAYESIGELMAAMHNQASAWTLPAGFKRHAFDADGFTGETPFWGRFWESRFLTEEEKSWFAHLRDALHAILRGLPKTRDNYSLIHADLHAMNLIMHDDQLHVIDFDDSGFGFHAYDLAVCAYGDEANLAALLDGYKRVRTPGEETLAWLPLFALLRQVASVGWATARPEIVPNRPDRLIESIREQADHVLGAIPV